MSTPTPVPQPAAPWYTSKVQLTQLSTAVFALIAVFPKIGQWLHLTSESDVSNAVSAIAGVAALLSPILGTIFRARSPLQPLTLTKAGADAHPQTQAAAFSHTVAQTQGGPGPASSGASPAPAPVLTVDKTKPWGVSK